MCQLAMVRLVLYLFIFLLPILSIIGHEFPFVENKGQNPDQVFFETNISRGKLFFEKDGVLFYQKAFQPGHNTQDDTDLYHLAQAFKLEFINPSPDVKIIGYNQSPYYYNYLRGDTLSHASLVHSFTYIKYENLYKGIDLIINNKEGKIKYEFVVTPRADAKLIKWKYIGNDDILLKDNKIAIFTIFGEIIDDCPYTYQNIPSKPKIIPTKYKYKDGIFSFDTDTYDHSKALIIDPELIFSTYSGSSADNWGYTATYDNDENFYGAGISFDIGYPTSIGVFDASFGGKCDITISKFSPDGSALLYATYLGGNDSDLPHSLIVNSNNQLVIFGTTGSSNFPTSSSAYDSNFNGGDTITVTNVVKFEGSDLFASILNENGTALIASTYIGGNRNDGLNTTEMSSLEFNYGDHARGEVMVDDNDNIYIASCTYSSNFPVNNGFSSNYKGALDGVFIKLNSNLSSVLSSSFLGGYEDDAAYSIRLNSNGDIYIAGGSGSPNFEFNGTGIDQSYNGGQADGFLLRISNSGNTMLNGTFLGTNQYDQVYFSDIDEENNVYVIGQSLGNYPISPNVYFNNNGHQFIQKINSTITTSLWSTVIGASNIVNFSPTAFMVDICDRIYISGWGGELSSSFYPTNTTGLPITGDALQSFTDGKDMYLMVLDKDAAQLEYGSYFGGIGVDEHVDGGTSRFDKQGRIYQAVCAGCGGSNNFPTTPNAYSQSNGTVNIVNNCNLGCMRIDFQPDIVIADAAILPDPTGCAPFEVNFQNNSFGGTEYLWDLGDGNTSTLFEPTHTYTQVGNYPVSLIVSDPFSCNIADTAYTTVQVVAIAETILAAFQSAIPGECEGYTVGFTNQSLFTNPQDQYVFYWSYGDGTGAYTYEQDHTYPGGGTYNVSLQVTGSPPCSVVNIASAQITLIDNPYVQAEITLTGNTCVPTSLELQSVYEAESYNWSIDPPVQELPNQQSITLNISEPGSYTINLEAIDSNTCNSSATTSTTIDIIGSPQALFSVYPDTLHVGEEFAFTNHSLPYAGTNTDLLSYTWDMGDGNSYMTENVLHSYELTNTYTICLKVTESPNLCFDEYCNEVYVDDEYAIGLPNAFTPNGDGINDVYSIEGFGLTNVILKIFNRWGEKVFESYDSSYGWDGTFRGADQPLEVYVYVLKANRPDGRPFTQKGNISLLR